MEIGLNCLLPGMCGVVMKIDCEETLAKQLCACGLVKGRKIRCTYRCPWGNMTALRLCGRVLVIRSDDLKKITVSVL